jgi:hypothetical protein
MYLLIKAAVLLSGLISMMCTTKVSEWVLLNAPPENYTLVYYYRDAVSDQERLANRAIEGDIRSANIIFREEKAGNIEKPYYALYYRNRLFNKYNSASELKDLSISPVRQKIATEIMDGKLCVMLYLRTGNKVKDEKGKEVIAKALEASPFSNIITLVELEKNNSAEAHLVSLLLNVEDDLAGIDEPMLFGVFGRFKALEPLLARGITEENIGLMIDFLTADCSCLIKDNLPGTDILFTNKWDNPVPALVNKILDENPSLQHF